MIAKISEEKTVSVVDEMTMAAMQHEQTFLQPPSSKDAVSPFSSLPREQRLMLLLVVRVCRRIAEAALNLPSAAPITDETPSAPSDVTTPHLEVEAPLISAPVRGDRLIDKDHENDLEKEESPVGEEKKGKDLDTHKEPQSANEDTCVVHNEAVESSMPLSQNESNLESECAEPGNSELETLISELVASGDSLRLQATTTDDSACDDLVVVAGHEGKLLVEAERAYVID